jgi:hypothetical protein
MSKYAPITTTLVCALVFGCNRTEQKTNDYIRQSEALQERYCGTNISDAEAALKELETLTEMQRRSGNASLRYAWIYGQIHGRLFLIYRHMGETNLAQKAFETSTQYFRSAGTGTSSPTSEQWTQSLEKLDFQLDVKWKRYKQP